MGASAFVSPCTVSLAKARWAAEISRSHPSTVRIEQARPVSTSRSSPLYVPFVLGFLSLSSHRRILEVCASAKAKKKKKSSMADLVGKMKRKKELKDRKKLNKRTSQDDEQQLEEENVTDWQGLRTCSIGRIVGGAERHGQVLVEVNEQLDADCDDIVWSARGASTMPIICEIPRGRRAPKEKPIVGDLVRVSWTDGAGDAEACVEEVLPRRTSLVRRHPAIPVKPQLLCANLDLVVLVLSVEPNFSEGMVDRVLVSAHSQNLEVAILLNKADLIPEGSREREETEERLAIYERVGYEVLFVSAVTGSGLPQLRQLLNGRTSILIGNSGVGKSHLLKELGQGQIEVSVGAISERLKLGKHTTTTSTLHRLPGYDDDKPAWLIDSPGARRFSIWDVEGEKLKDHFVEFTRYMDRCRFSDCNHLHEPDCAVKDAVEEGLIPRERYLSYLRIREQLLEGKEGQKMLRGRLMTSGAGTHDM